MALTIPRCAIGVMAKAPQAGRSKTRLCPPLSPDQAAALSGAFLRDTTENLMKAALDVPIDAYAAYAPAGTEQLLQNHVAAGTRLILADGTPPMPDGVDGFGRCLLHAMQGMLAAGYVAACVLSSDVPTLPTRLLIEVARALLAPSHGSERVVLGASPDGGYYVLGVRHAYPALFTDIAWSTDSVADATRARARRLGVELVELDPWYDIDDAQSLATLLKGDGGYPAPRTRAVIERLGLNTLLGVAAA